MFCVTLFRRKTPAQTNNMTNYFTAVKTPSLALTSPLLHSRSYEQDNFPKGLDAASDYHPSINDQGRTREVAGGEVVDEVGSQSLWERLEERLGAEKGFSRFRGRRVEAEGGNASHGP